MNGCCAHAPGRDFTGGDSGKQSCNQEAYCQYNQETLAEAWTIPLIPVCFLIDRGLTFRLLGYYVGYVSISLGQMISSPFIVE